MSKRAIFLIILGLLVLTGLFLSNFGRNLPIFPFRDPVFTEHIPGSRPKQLDRRLIERFSGSKINQILDTIKAERSSDPESTPTPEIPLLSETLLSSLPDAPLPFPDEATPRDEEHLKSFVTSIQKSPSGTPAKEELWEFTLALSALKIDPSQLPESLRQETNPTPESDTFPVRLKQRAIDLEGAFCIGNFDKTDDLEIISGGGTTVHKLDSSGELHAISWMAGIAPGKNLYPADYDADGDLDLLIIRGDGLPNSLLRNRGDGQFGDVTNETGLLSFSDTTVAAWLDYDNDGFLDLIIGSEDHPLELYRQTNIGTFQSVAWDLKLWVPRGVRHLEVTDFSGDGYPDLYVGIEGLPDRLYRNQPNVFWSEWRFQDIASQAGISASSTASAATFFDFDNDGNPDLATGTSSPDNTEGSGVQIFYNNGDGTFLNLSAQIELPTIPAISALDSVDLDNDGFSDLVVGTGPLQINRVLWNREGTGFREVSVTTRGSFLDHPISIFTGDPDANGHADWIYQAESGKIRWLQATGNIQNWIRVVLTESNIGTQVTVVTRDPDWIVHTVTRTMDRDPSVTIGLGEASSIEAIDVAFADGSKAIETLTQGKLNQKLEIKLPKSARKGPLPPSAKIINAAKEAD
tara:strand:- start:7168 stop:9069 length:1902 start_codon:yes stop_codon:yes gene_type:complete